MALSDKYDFSLFESRSNTYNYGSAAPALPEPEPKYPKPRLVPKPKKTSKKITKPELDPETKRHVQREPWEVIKRLFVIASVSIVIGLYVQKNAHLTELTAQIEIVQNELEDARATETQLQLSIDHKFNNLDIDKYAREELGLQKITRAQVTHIQSENLDHGIVHEQKSEWEKFTEKIQIFINSLKFW